MTMFASTLKSARESAGLSQAKLAREADFDHSYISRLESGVRMPTRDAVERLCRLMPGTQRAALLTAAGFTGGHDPMRDDLTSMRRDLMGMCLRIDAMLGGPDA